MVQPVFSGSVSSPTSLLSSELLSSVEASLWLLSLEELPLSLPQAARADTSMSIASISAKMRLTVLFMIIVVLSSADNIC